MKKRFCAWALSLLLAVSLFTPVPTAQEGVVLRVGPGGDCATAQQALDSLGADTGALTLLFTADLGEQGALELPPDKGITTVTLGSDDGGLYTVGAYEVYASGIPLTVDGVKINYLYGGGHNQTVPSTSITVRSGSVRWLLGGGGADVAGGVAQVTGQVSIRFENADVAPYSNNDDYLWGGGGTSTAGTDVSVGSVSISISGTTMQREIMGGSYVSARDAVGNTGHVDIAISDCTIEGDVYGGGESSGTSATSTSQSTRIAIQNSTFPLYDGTYGGNILGGGFIMNTDGCVDVLGSAVLDIKNSTITAAIGGPLAFSSKTARAGSTSVTLTGCTVRELVCGGSYSGDGVAAVYSGSSAVHIIDGITFPGGGAIYTQGYVEEDGTATVEGASTLTITGSPVTVGELSGPTDLALGAPLAVTGQYIPADPDRPAAVSLLGTGWRHQDALISYQGQDADANWFTFADDSPAAFQPGPPAVWSLNTPDIRVTAQIQGQGSIDPSDPQTVPWNSTVTFTAHPAAGWQLDSVTAGGQPVEVAQNSFSLPSLRADVALNITFRPLPVQLQDPDTQVQLVCPPESLPAGADPAQIHLQVEPVDRQSDDWNTVHTALADRADQLVTFDIGLYLQDTKVQPGGKVQVSIPIPAGFDRSRLLIYRVEPTGDLVQYPVTVSGDLAQFETDHFSYYVLIQQAAQSPLPAESTLYFADAAGGRVLARAGSAQVRSGQPLPVGTAVQFTAVPASGYQFSRWQVDDRTVAAGADGTLTVTVTDGAQTVTAVFVPAPTGGSEEPTDPNAPTTVPAGSGAPGTAPVPTGDHTALPAAAALALVLGLVLGLALAAAVPGICRRRAGGPH